MYTFADPTLTVDRVVGVMEKVTSDEEKRKEVWEWVLEWYEFTPNDYHDKEYAYHLNKTSDLAYIYVNSRPGPSWEDLTRSLYTSGEMSAAKEAKSYLRKSGK